MEVKWTEEQQKVIDLRDRNILVSAAAGSGKTAVLVERILSMLTDPVHPVDVDRLLVVTFTKAAAAEMKERLRDAIEKLLEERMEDEHLQRQATLVHSAQITTIDSFCQAVIRDHFHRIDLEPGFRVAEEGELKLLKQDVLEELLESRYEAGEAEFLEFVEAYATGRDDRKLEELILRLYDFSRSYPDPEGWLDACGQAYGIEQRSEQRSNNGIPRTLEERIFQMTALYLQDARALLEQAYGICMEADGPYMYEEMIASDQRILDEMSAGNSLKDLYEKSAPIRKKTAWKRLSSKRDTSVSSEKKEQVKALRSEARKIAEELCEQYFYAPPSELAADMERCRKPMWVLVELVGAFSEAFSEKKRSRNVIDFGDMEHFALKILTEKRGGELVPSQAAEEYQERYVEVMIDEYQDSNLLQEAILTSVSTANKGKNNIFMVGDVKQSIYRFRLSRPELFMEKFDTYSLEDSDAQRVDLHKNFRSRVEVLNGVNFMFRQIMRKDLGGIAYDDQAALYPGAPYEVCRDAEGNSLHRVEVLLMDTQQETAENEETLKMDDTQRELEARAVAVRIQQLLREGSVQDNVTKKMRKPSYRDIVILTRSVKGWADVFSEVLKDQGIPTYAGKTEGYFETYEVSLLLDYLKVLDNQRQDLALAAVLTSPLCGLDADALARIRNEYPEAAFHEAVQMCCAMQETESPLSERMSERLRRTWETVQYFREKVSYTAIHELLWEILEKTGYYHLISAMPGGEQRKANLDMLLAKAAVFEETSYKGLFQFVRYIEQLKKYDVDYGEANITDEQMDAVRIMSIHKSKGLEFPIVFVCGMSKQFQKRDATGSVVIHPELGIGIDAVDLEHRTKTPTLLKKMMQKEILLENLGEELRVLYVALTRAKEKLILIGTVEKAEEKLAKYTDIKECKERELPFSRLSRANTYFDWVLPALVRRTETVPIDVVIWGLSDLARESAVKVQAEMLAKDVLLHWEKDCVYDSKWREELEQMMSYQYPFVQDQKMKMKFTVSELKKRESLRDDDAAAWIEEPKVVPLIPKFLEKTEGLTGAPRGSAYHKVLELLDFSQGYDGAHLQNALEMLVETRKLSEEMAKSVCVDDILFFLECKIGRRICAAAGKGMLRREQPFVLGVEAAEIYPNNISAEDDGEMILIQGIIDVYFEEKDGLVLLDYKTDKVRAGKQLKEKYHAQLQYYAKALEQLTGKRVKEKWIYSFTLREEIAV